MTAKLHRLVIDTNIFLSAALNPSSTPARFVEKALKECEVIRSIETWNELESVLMRAKFDRYQAETDRRHYFEYLAEFVQEIPYIRKSLYVATQAMINFYRWRLMETLTLSSPATKTFWSYIRFEG